jgi:hypothetical protein
MSFKYFPRDEQAIGDAKTKQDREAVSNMPQHYLQPGRTVLRVLPAFSEKGVWFEEFKEHYCKIGGESHYLVDPETFGEFSPFSAYGRKLAEEGTEAAIKKASAFRPTHKYLLNVVVLSDAKGRTAKDGVKILKVGKTIITKLIDFDTDVDGGWGDITNLETGRVITIEKEGTLRDTSYNTKAHPEKSNFVQMLAEQGIDINSLVMHDLTSMIQVQPKEELESLLEQLVAQSDSTPQPVTAVTVTPVEVRQTTIAPQVTTPAPTPVSPSGISVVAPPPVTSGKGGA